MQTFIKYIENKYLLHKMWPVFSTGDVIQIFYLIKEGTKCRTQSFKGIVIQCRGKGTSESFTIKKNSGGIGIKRIFFVSQPNIQQIEIHSKGKVRKSRIYYFSLLKGKKARIKYLISKK